MPIDPHATLNDPIVSAALKQAWHDSQSGTSGGHEEGGFVLRDSTVATTLTADVLKDELAVSLARALAAANKHARELGMDVVSSLITITQRAFNGQLLWRINYGPKELYRAARR